MWFSLLFITRFMFAKYLVMVKRVSFLNLLFDISTYNYGFIFRQLLKKITFNSLKKLHQNQEIYANLMSFSAQVVINVC